MEEQCKMIFDEEENCIDKWYADNIYGPKYLLENYYVDFTDTNYASAYNRVMNCETVEEFTDDQKNQNCQMTHKNLAIFIDEMILMFDREHRKDD